MAYSILRNNVYDSSKKCNLTHFSFLLVHGKFTLKIIITMNRKQLFKGFFSLTCIHQIMLNHIVEQIGTHIKIQLCHLNGIIIHNNTISGQKGVDLVYGVGANNTLPPDCVAQCF